MNPIHQITHFFYGVSRFTCKVSRQRGGSRKSKNQDGEFKNDKTEPQCPHHRRHRYIRMPSPKPISPKAITLLSKNEVGNFKKFNPDLFEDVTFFFANVTEETEVQKTIEEFVSQFGSLDVLVNIVGGFVGGIPATELEEDRWDFMMNLNLKSVFLCCKEFRT